MLDSETKRRIDTARDILVGKVPDPKSQVEQITIALIYKFMDDMDAEAEELGGERKFFNDEFAKYGWAKLMSPAMGGHEVLNLYAEAITKMSENERIPALFRDIFKNAYLPYRDPETLKSFLKIINDFEYDHSERLGDAFEYLLSVLGAQGDAGQFRTPRHIIDFMVEVIDPKKDESILDPACGTAGFLISSWKHILQANSKDGRKGAELTPDERKCLTSNIKGYDISPDMVRLSLVNLYLHGFTDPHISEYDTLTSEDNWNKHSDIILANPPFMSPKGGIKPHKRFSIQAKRSEVLFVDYIVEHLTPSGRAAVIVPEGIVFHGQKAYKQLRKMLVENYLYAVVSLPAGIFQPYSGVKTSILLMDKIIAKKCDSILFVKIENDGFDLGAQRQKINKNDLPEVKQVLHDFYQACLTGKVEGFDTEKFYNVLKVKKEAISKNVEWSLSGEKYGKKDKLRVANYELVKLGDVCDFKRGPFGGSLKKEIFVDSGYAVYEQSHAINNQFVNIRYFIDEAKFNEMKVFKLNPGDLIMSCSGTMGKVAIAPSNIIPGIINQALLKLTPKPMISIVFLKLWMESDHFQESLSNLTFGAAIKNVASVKVLKEVELPLPPLKIQQEIIAEIESYQNQIGVLQSEIFGNQKKIEDTIASVWGEK